MHVYKHVNVCIHICMYLPEREKDTDVIPQRTISFLNSETSPHDLISKNLQVESSEPVPKAFPSGNKVTELMSLSCPN